jgi:nucleoside-diphosphate-sugar epimerase
VVRVLVLGGTRFLGQPTVRWLLEAGHEVKLFHRGDTEPLDALDAEHIHGDFASITDHLPRLIALRPDVVLDLVPYIDKAGHGVSHFAGVAERGVVVTSLDVYRAFAIAWGSEVAGPEAMPLTEESPLRVGPSPDLTEDIDFDNLEVERALLDRPELPVTVLRLPMIYGPSAPMHRLFGYLRRMDDGRPAIVLDEARAGLRWSRGYVENVAAAVGLAVADSRSAGRVFNVAESETPTEAEWVRRIGDTVGWQGNIVVVPGEALPLRIRSPLKVRQDLAVSSERIRAEVGYSEPVDAKEALERTVVWQRENPPEFEAPDYRAEDAVLQAAAPQGT